MGSTPVANGSRVPACPTLARVRRRTTSTTRFEVRPSGLSTTIQPSRPPSFLIVSVLSLDGLWLEVAHDLGSRKQGGDPVRLIERIVARKHQVRRIA